MMNQNKDRVDILECTLRDGSYAIDYQFTAEDTAIIAFGLDQAGFPFIEVGHGLGLGASLRGHGKAAATDRDYLLAASQVVKKARFGMFCIPGIAQLKDLNLAAKQNMGFVRIGTNVTEIKKAEPFIKKAKDLRMMVFSNLMKSYALSPLDFAKKVRSAYQYGADVICVVDSAGGMLPEDVREYIRIIKNETDAIAAFHGHDNLCLAIANSLEAIKAGAAIVDSSLQGLGRSAGNAQTEVLVILLEKIGYCLDIDLYKTLELGDRIIRSIAAGQRGVDSINAILGAKQFHSSFMKIIDKFAKKYDLDPKELITDVSNKSRVNVTEELVKDVARKLIKQKKPNKAYTFDFDLPSLVKTYHPLRFREIAFSMAQEMINLSKKTGKRTVFTLAKSLNRHKRYTTFPFIRQNESCIIGNAELARPEDGLEIIKVIDGLIDYVFLDHALFSQFFKHIRKKKSIYLAYSDFTAQVVSLSKIIDLLLLRKSKVIFINGVNLMTKKLTFDLLCQGYTVVSNCGFEHRDYRGGFTGRALDSNLDNIRRADAVVGLTPFEHSITKQILKILKKTAFIIDAGPGSISPQAINYGIKNGFSIYRIDMRAGLFGEIESVLKSYFLKNNIMAEGKMNGIRVVSGGVIGKRGDIVLDSVKMPSRIIGVADGKGGLLKEKELSFYSKRIEKAKKEIARAMFS